MHFAELRTSRQKFIVSAGLGLVATDLTACTTYGKKPAAAGDPTAAPTTTGSAPATGAPASPAPVRAIAETSDVPVGSGVIIDDIVLTQPSEGEIKGLSAICTHAGCTVSEVQGGTINCRCHGSKFDLDGSVANGPASRPLDTKGISVLGGSIVLG
ncbi:MAG: Rieske Fe-S protein [Mycobacterium sp.]|jgi:Rieske Fe-S protein|nr:Rieske Fe-S protein [Mycobacterium sp.]